METEIQFLADAMLGSLARWLRVLGHDTHYQRAYTTEALEKLVSGGRRLLSRHKKTVNRVPFSVLLLSEKVGEQILQLRDTGLLTLDRSRWFTRCLVCNVTLERPSVREATEAVPDHVSYLNIEAVRYCPSCGRYYWPGSHRERMILQLKVWGF